ncbi:hypothetical protein Bbelb_328740 [Branchiostoma belcheri]|nr:hypothetical protein Bbelb_328740 [Branchiostoma belcheri]
MAGRQQDRQTVDVKEYFDKVIKGVSHKWDDLARKLGFDRNEIKGIETTEPSPNHRCREVLERWRNREGREATLQVLQQALIDIKESLTAESLEVTGATAIHKQRKGEPLEQVPVKESKKPRTESDSEDGESNEEAVAQPGPITIAEVTENSTRINWTEAAGAKDSYRISISPQNFVTNSTAIVNTGNPLEHTFTTLTAGTEYTISVVTVSGGMCSVARTKTQRTTVAQPGPITIAEVTENIIRITWTEAAGAKDSYRINISLVTIVTNSTGSVNTGATLEHTFTGLTAGTEYTISVVTVSGGECSVARTKTQRTNEAITSEDEDERNNKFYKFVERNAVETGELFQKDVDDGSWGSEGKGQGDKGDGSSSDGDSDDGGDSGGAARCKATPRPSTAYDEHTSDDSLSDDTDREASASGPGGSHSNKEEDDIPQQERISLDSASRSSTANQSVYPTGEDALAWNDCLQDFFKTDEVTARSIQQNWPSNLLVKHLIRDSIRQFLMAYWVAHTVRTQTDCTDLLRVCAEKSDHLPITCCSLAHLLSRADSPPTHLQQVDSPWKDPRKDPRKDIVGLKYERKLKKVNLSHNKLSDRGDFLPPLPNLEEIDLSDNDISDEAVPALAKGLGSCQNLKKVNLSYNKLSGRGDFLPPLPNLEEIDLNHNAISDEAVPGLAEGLGSCQNLKMIDLSYNKLSDVRELIKAFINLPTLTRVVIDHNSIRDESLPTIAAWLKVSTAVERVDLDDNRFSAEGVRDFVRTMKGKACSWGNDLLYDGSQADVHEAVESGGEGARREEQQWERLRRVTGSIKVKVGQLTVVISHEGRRSNNTQLASP